MTVSMVRRARAAGLVAGMLVVLGGCASMDQRPAEELVKERAQARADKIVQGDIKGAYEYLSPGSRQGMTSEQYATTVRLGFWKAVKIEKVVCETPNSCDAHMTVDYEFRGSRITTPARETWVKEGSTWWYLRK